MATYGATPVKTGRTEVDVFRVARAGRIKGRRPVVAVGPRIVEFIFDPAASSRQEYAVAVSIAGNESSVNIIACGPCPCALCDYASL